MNDNLYRNINGLLQRDSTFSSLDTGIRTRFGLFETMLYREGTIRNADLHWQRLFRGLPLLGFTPPPHYTPAYFGRLVAELVHANELPGPLRVRLQVLKSGEGTAPFFFIETFPLDPGMTAFNEAGLNIGILEGYSKPADIFSNLKLSHNDYAASAAAAMRGNRWDDVLLRNTQGHIIESAIANIFMIKDGEIITPPLSEGCLAGTMRAWLIPQLQQAGFPVSEQALTRAMLDDADEVFLTNSIRPLRHLDRIGEQTYGYQMVSSIWELIRPLL